MQLIFAPLIFMLMLRKGVLLFTCTCLSIVLFAQNPLPSFGVQTVGLNKIRISWVNPFGDACIQLNVQRSYDSLKNFHTIFSTPSPQLPQNGFIDDKAYGNRNYYRIFYMLNGNAYYFTKSRSLAGGVTEISNMDEQKDVTIKIADTVFKVLQYPLFKAFSDSILKQTRDSLFTVAANTVLLKHYVPQTGWTPSLFLFADRTGNIVVRLPAAKEKKYSLIIYDVDNTTTLFNIRHFSENELVLNKENFLHSGWFMFELFEDEHLKERNKFYLQKEFQ